MAQLTGGQLGRRRHTAESQAKRTHMHKSLLAQAATPVRGGLVYSVLAGASAADIQHPAESHSGCLLLIVHSRCEESWLGHQRYGLERAA
jgi:hypothetical protein